MTTPQTDPDGRWFCEACQARYDSSGDCVRCPDEPLLDLHHEDTRLAIEELDASRRRKRHTMLGLIALAVCFPLVLLVGIFSTKLGVLAWVGATGALTGVLWKLFPTKDRLPDMEGFQSFTG